MWKFDISSSQIQPKPAIVQFGHNFWNKLTGKYDHEKTALETTITQERKNISRGSSIALRNVIDRQSIHTYIAWERLSPSETAQKIRNIFGDVESVSMPRSNGIVERAFKKSNGLFYFSWSSHPCYLEKGERVSLQNNERQETRSPAIKKITSNVRKSVSENTEWDWESKNIFKRLFSWHKSQNKQPPSFPTYYNPQNRWNNCGPTACSMVAAKLLGIDPEVFENKHTNKTWKNMMEWSSPKNWLGPLGLSVQERDGSNLSQSELHQILQDPNKAVIASVRPWSWLTQHKHITALVGSQKTNEGYIITNADPNYNNIRKWLGHIPAERLAHGGAKHYWIVEKNSVA